MWAFAKHYSRDQKTGAIKYNPSKKESFCHINPFCCNTHQNMSQICDNNRVRVLIKEVLPGQIQLTGQPGSAGPTAVHGRLVQREAD
jgi:hypothetical protein